MNKTNLSSGIGVWFEQEIENVIRSIDESNSDVADAIPTAEMAVYRRGFRAAVNAMAVAFGLNYRSESYEDFL